MTAELAAEGREVVFAWDIGRAAPEGRARKGMANETRGKPGFKHGATAERDCKGA